LTGWRSLYRQDSSFLCERTMLCERTRTQRSQAR